MRRLLSLVLALALLLGCAAAETAEPRNEDAQITSKNLPLYYQKADRIWREDSDISSDQNAAARPFRPWPESLNGAVTHRQCVKK